MNKAYLIGNLTRDVELKTTQSGYNVVNFTIAVNRRHAKDGQQECDFINIVAWRQLADLCAKYLAKGKKVAVVGAIQTRTYEAQDGSKRTAFEILADEVEFLSPAGQKGDTVNQAGYTPAISSPSNPAQGMTQADDTELPF